MKQALSLILLAIIFTVSASFYSGAVSKGSYHIVVDKSDYEVHVYDSEGWLITYPIVLGNNNLGDKMMQGDRKTPEGTFTIIAKRPHGKWHRYMALNYPTAESYARFNERKAKGLIPANAQIGGDIGIHGTWPREDYAIDQFQNWTLGCISLKNQHVSQLYSMIPVGTKIVIQR